MIGRSCYERFAKQGRGREFERMDSLQWLHKAVFLNLSPGPWAGRSVESLTAYIERIMRSFLRQIATLAWWREYNSVIFPYAVGSKPILFTRGFRLLQKARSHPKKGKWSVAVPPGPFSHSFLKLP